VRQLAIQQVQNAPQELKPFLFPLTGQAMKFMFIWVSFPKMVRKSQTACIWVAAKLLKSSVVKQGKCFLANEKSCSNERDFFVTQPKEKAVNNFTAFFVSYHLHTFTTKSFPKSLKYLPHYCMRFATLFYKLLIYSI
jgi:hypothetical protein